MTSLVTEVSTNAKGVETVTDLEDRLRFMYARIAEPAATLSSVEVGALEWRRGDAQLIVASTNPPSSGRAEAAIYLAAIRAISIFHSGRTSAGTVTSVLLAR